MSCLLCQALSERFNMAADNDWQQLTPLYIQAITEHAEMCHCEEHETEVNVFMSALAPADRGGRGE